MLWYSPIIIVEKFCTQSPHNLNLTTVHWEGLDAYNVNGTVPVGSVITAYCNEGMKKSTNVMMNGKCAASLRLDGVYSECTGKKVGMSILWMFIIRTYVYVVKSVCIRLNHNQWIRQTSTVEHWMLSSLIWTYTTDRLHYIMLKEIFILFCFINCFSLLSKSSMFYCLRHILPFIHNTGER